MNKLSFSLLAGTAVLGRCKSSGFESHGWDGLCGHSLLSPLSLDFLDYSLADVTALVSLY